MTKQSNSHSAEFRIYGDMSPDVISSVLGIEATNVQSAGAPRPVHGTWDRNMWGLEADVDEDAPLAEHIEWLCSVLATKKGILQRLTQDCTAVFWCACFSTTVATTIEIGPELMMNMASCHATFSVSIYPAR